MAKEFPTKERRAVHLAQKAVDEQIREYVQRVAHHRAPWFASGVKEVTWCTEVAFEQRLASQFGRGRCWLLGDAAHQTGPVGVQSLNAGLQEAEALAGCLRSILRENASPDRLTSFGRERQSQWRRQLGLSGGLQAGADTAPWVRAHSARLLPCLPGTETDLAQLAAQLKLDLR
jgi:2-polyprenyl-6-methoxyphenol hydroxylase-like FAD-dependent oxidoreductase